VFKKAVTPSNLIDSEGYRVVFDHVFSDGGDMKALSIIGHSRLATNGKQGSNANNHPVIKQGLVGVHNGIIVNVDELFEENPTIKREFDVDTEVILGLLRQSLEGGDPLPDSVRKAFSAIYGETSLAILFDDINKVLLATNTGSLFCCLNKAEDLQIFASEKYFLKEIISDPRFRDIWNGAKLFQVKPDTFYLVETSSLKIEAYPFEVVPRETRSEEPRVSRYLVDDLSKEYPIKREVARGRCCKLSDEGRDRIRREIAKQSRPDDNMRRCTRCLLPETFPFIEFDDEGVCNYCREYKRVNHKGVDDLRKLLGKFKSESGEPDCIVGFSGGRDSSYMLHYIKRVLGMNPIAFSYDWGMITDLGRRNQARLTGRLGVEHIWISADIEKKRENIRKNIEAWLKRPELGLVPLLMAGDKQFYYYAHKLIEQTGVKIIFNGANPFEKTSFKLGFCGIREGDTRGKGLLTGISALNKIRLPIYYASQYLLNPSYINSSFFDTLHAYYSTYLLHDIYLYFYNYIPWNEEEIISLLRREYDWEIANDTQATWRIGDGTAAFYNYIYYTVAGFSEFDTFRSNQIREGLISREEGLRLVRNENIPRVESLEWYANTIGFDLEEALSVIHSIPKLYETGKE
jgi:asparagine synthetase B (glutamine-hydrolysing)